MKARSLKAWMLGVVSAAVMAGVGVLQGYARDGKPIEQGEYSKAMWTALHFPPAIDSATDEQCLSCHRDVLDRKPRDKSPAGVEAARSLAWYQTLDTYAGEQEGFHYRHIASPLAKDVMKLSCTFCHRGHDPREETTGSSATAAAIGSKAGFAMRKMVEPTATCLRCHGQFPYENMGLPGPWHEARESFETDGVKNGCLGACHGETFRLNRHQVTYLDGKRIEELAQESSDVCLGCHGGRAWYRNSFPYPRNPWPGMDPATPDWAKERPTQSEDRYRIVTGK